MKKLIIFRSDIEDSLKLSIDISQAIKDNSWIQLVSKNVREDTIKPELLPKGPGFIISSGGSSGNRYQCLQPFSNLNKSALNSGTWLKSQGIEPNQTVILNPLPMHHISGLMPWWRSRLWGAHYMKVEPSVIKEPTNLDELPQQILNNQINKFIISLVPTQLHRLINNHVGLKWLKLFDLIWIGGGALSKELADKARDNYINLAPCYGSTETASMVASMTPKEFLAGRNDCGSPFKGVKLNVDKNNQLQIKAKTLAIGKYSNGKIEKITENSGWWQSGDMAQLSYKSNKIILGIKGRIDNAINSGGETIFPEVLENRLLQEANIKKLAIKHIFFLPVQSNEWGNRMIALISFHKKYTNSEIKVIFLCLKNIVRDWPPAEKPMDWYECPELETNEEGKWEKGKWIKWVKSSSKQHFRY